MKYRYDLSECLGKTGSDSYFYTFISRPGLAAGVLVLEPGQQDTQEPHDSDEVYLVLSGDGFLRIGNRDHKVSKDAIFFVPRNTPHHFHGNTSDLSVLYFFGGGPDS